jgi:hypothetical protein
VYKFVHISSDRSAEECAERKKLVSQLKQKIEKEPGLYHFIQNGKVNSTEKLTPSPPPTSSTSAETRIEPLKHSTPKRLF